MFFSNTSKLFCAAATACAALAACELNVPPYLSQGTPDAGTAGAAGATSVTPPDEPVAQPDAGTEPTVTDPVGDDQSWIGGLNVSYAKQVGVPLMVRVHVVDSDGIDYCHLSVGGSDPLPMAITDPEGVPAELPFDGVGELAYVPTEPGELTLQVTCVDGDGDALQTEPVTVTVEPAPPPPPVDDKPPTLQMIAPFADNTLADIRDGISIASRCWDPSGIESCEAFLNGVSQPTSYDPMTLQCRALAIVPSTGVYAVSSRCTDTEGNVADGPVRNVTVYAVAGLGTTVARVGTASVNSVVVGTAVTYSASVEEHTTLASCQFLFDGVVVGTVSGLASPINATLTTNVAGSHTAQFSCVDVGGASHLSGIKSITVTPDVTAPVVGAVSWSPNAALLIVGNAYTYSASASDEFALAGCDVTLTGGSAVAATVSGGVASASLVYNGQAGVTVTCRDTTGNATSRSAVLTAAPPPDTTAPVVTVLAYAPADAALTAGSIYAFSANAADNVGVVGCELVLGTGAPIAATLSGGVASASAVYADETAATLTCRDAAGLSGSASIALTAAVPEPPPPPPAL